MHSKSNLIFVSLNEIYQRKTKGKISTAEPANSPWSGTNLQLPNSNTFCRRAQHSHPKSCLKDHSPQLFKLQPACGRTSSFLNSWIKNEALFLNVRTFHNATFNNFDQKSECHWSEAFTQSRSYQYSSPLSHKTAKSTFWNMSAVWNTATSVHIWLNTSINFQNAKWVQNPTTNECKGESTKIPKHHFNMQHIIFMNISES